MAVTESPARAGAATAQAARTTTKAALSVVGLYLITAFHHVYGGLAYDEPRRLTEPVVFGVVLVVTLLPLYGYVRRGGALLLALFSVLAVARSATAMFDGGYHLVKVVVYYLLPDGAERVAALPRFLPDSSVVVPDDVFFQGSGILALILSFVPIVYVLRLWRERAAH